MGAAESTGAGQDTGRKRQNDVQFNNHVDYDNANAGSGNSETSTGGVFVSVGLERLYQRHQRSVNEDTAINGVEPGAGATAAAATANDDAAATADIYHEAQEKIDRERDENMEQRKAINISQEATREQKQQDERVPYGSERLTYADSLEEEVLRTPFILQGRAVDEMLFRLDRESELARSEMELALKSVEHKNREHFQQVSSSIRGCARAALPPLAGVMLREALASSESQWLEQQRQQDARRRGGSSPQADCVSGNAISAADAEAAFFPPERARRSLRRQVEANRAFFVPHT